MSRRRRRRSLPRGPSGQSRRVEVWLVALGIGTLGAVAIVAIIIGGAPEPEVIDDVVIVHNPRCPHTGRVIPPQLRGRYQTRVRYDGENARYRGKTLVFDFGGPECAQYFSAEWEADADAILREHVLSDDDP